MGMFDKPEYLTGNDGYVQPGDTFWLHNARPDGTVKVNGQERPQVKLHVSRTQDGPRSVVYTSGAGIVGQIQRMDPDDQAAMRNGGMEVRLDEVRSSQGNPTRVLTPANMPPAQANGSDFETAPDF